MLHITAEDSVLSFTLMGMFMVRKIILIILIALVCVSQSFAVDGIRKGFVLGFGMGTASGGKSFLKSNDVEVSFDGFGGNLFAGYCWDNKNILYWEDIGVLHFSSNSKKGDTIKGINGITWYHYFKPHARTFFTVIGTGEYVTYVEYNKTEYRSSGFGIVVGGGYEFTKQLQFGAYLLSGKSNLKELDRNRSSMLVATLSLVIY